MSESAKRAERNPDTDYERRDLPLLPLLMAALGLTVLLGLTPELVRIGWPSTRNDVDRHLAIKPPAPRLQTNPRADLATYLAEQHKLLNSYGWVDRGKGIAREPIGVAMQQILHTGIDGMPKQQAPQ